MPQLNRYEKYINQTYAGQRLLKEYSLNDFGYWRIFGEDPNCDLGGYHHEPELGMYEGKLSDVIKFAVELKGFWAWGSGGRILKIGTIQKIDAQTTKEVLELKAQKTELESKLQEINEKIRMIGAE